MTEISIHDAHPAPKELRISYDSIDYEQVSVIRAGDRTKEISYVGETREEWLENIGLSSVGTLAVCYAQWVYEELNKQSGVSITAHQVEQMVLHARQWMNVTHDVVPVNEGALVTPSTDRMGADEGEQKTVLSSAVKRGKSEEPSEPSLDAEVLTQEDALTETR